MVLTHPLGAGSRYLPYAPRQQRHAIPNPAWHGAGPAHSATLKSVAKDLGVGSHSVGWAILDRLISLASESVGLSSANDNTPWMEIWNAIGVGKATILLPSEDLGKIVVTTEMIKDHIVFIEPKQDRNRQVVSLSGLRGVLTDDSTSITLTFRSTLHPTSKLFHALASPPTHFFAFAHLPPLPQHCHLTVPAGDPPVPYPSYAISSPPKSASTSSTTSGAPDTLPIPLPRSSAVQPKPPPLPPRPLSYRSPTPVPASTTTSPSRLHNPFASFFGGGTTTSVKSSPSLGITATASPSSSPLMHTISLPPETHSGGTEGAPSLADPALQTALVDVPVLVMDRTIVRDVLASEVNGAIHAEMAHALTSKTTAKSIVEAKDGDGGADEGVEEFDIPEWVLERVHEFVGFRLAMYPFVHKQKSTGDDEGSGDGGGGGTLDLSRRLEIAIAGRGSVRGSSDGGGGGGRRRSRERTRQASEVEEQASGAAEYVVTKAGSETEDVTTRIQDFYAELEKEVRVRQEKAVERRRGRERSDGEEREDTSVKAEEVEVDRLVKRVVEAVESVICSLFYDRLFMQPDSDDASHDETLASRVAALNMLDLTLEHLDVDVGEAEEEIELVVRACGQTLMQLEVCYSPADKAAILVSAHKVIVDGLSKLPPIRLIPEEESRANRENQQAQRALKPPFGTELKEIPQPGDKKEAERREGPEGNGGGLEKGTMEVNVASRIPQIVEPANEEGEAMAHDQKAQDGALGEALTKHSPPSLSSPPGEADGKSKPIRPTTISGDVLLPILIFSVAKSNPLRLVSHLLFTQRFRNQVILSGSNSGEESYCLVNLLAVAEFLENVDLEGLGLIKEGDRLLPSAAELTPIPILRSPVIDAAKKEGDKAIFDAGLLPGTLRGKVEQQVDAIAGSANKVLAGLMDTSFGMLKSFLPGQPAPFPPSTGQPAPQPQIQVITPASTPTSGASWNVVRPGFDLLKREGGFSITSIAASLPIGRPPKSAEEEGQQMITVSRLASVKSSSRLDRGGENDEGTYVVAGSSFPGMEDVEGNSGEEVGEGSEEGRSGEDEEDASMYQFDRKGSVKSIRSFESMMSERGGKGRKTRTTLASGTHQKNASGYDSPVGGNPLRKSLTDRLAHMSALAGTKNSPPVSRRTSLMPNVNTLSTTHTPVSRPSTPEYSFMRVAPPIQRFVECSPDDLKVSEIGDLLRDYQRLADAIRMMGGFSDSM